MTIDRKGILDRLEVVEALLELGGPGLVPEQEGEPEEALGAEEVVVVLLVGADDHIEPAERAAHPGRVTRLVVVGQEVARALPQERRQVGVVRRDRVRRPPETRRDREDPIRPRDRVRHGVERLRGMIDAALRGGRGGRDGDGRGRHGGGASRGRAGATARSYGGRPCGGRGSPPCGPAGPPGTPRSRPRSMAQG